LRMMTTHGKSRAKLWARYDYAVTRVCNDITAPAIACDARAPPPCDGASEMRGDVARQQSPASPWKVRR